MTDIKTELRIPDFWFDFYARFLPGVAFVMVVRLVIYRDSSFPIAWEIPCLAFAGYFCALITQPLASMITGWIENCFAKKFVKAENGAQSTDYVRTLAWYLSTLPDEEKQKAGTRLAMILSKMHGETTFFAQLLVFGAVVFVLQLVSRFPLCVYGLIFNFVCEIVFLGGACQVAYRRLKRAQKHGEITGYDKLCKKQGKTKKGNVKGVK